LREDPLKLNFRRISRVGLEEREAEMPYAVIFPVREMLVTVWRGKRLTFRL
jgi:hypothetical protein